MLTAELVAVASSVGFGEVIAVWQVQRDRKTDQEPEDQVVAFRFEGVDASHARAPEWR